MKIALNHLHFRSEDPDAAAKWYCDNFGAKITSERPLSTTKSIQLELNGEHIMTISGRAEGEDPIAGTTDPRYGLDHFGFETDDLEQLSARLKKNVMPATRSNCRLSPGFPMNCYSDRAGSRSACAPGSRRTSTAA